jgi:PD-(D/E)XK endonuclease
MRSPTRGNAGEAAVLNALVQRNFRILVPFGDGHPYDLAIDLKADALLRVQCKIGWPTDGCVRFNSRTTDHGRGRLSYRGLADLFGVYFPPSKAVYLVPIDAVAESEGRLRLEPTRNNQPRRVRFAADYEIDSWTVEGLRRLAGARTVGSFEDASSSEFTLAS